jgi:hypothetical protein
MDMKHIFSMVNVAVEDYYLKKISQEATGNIGTVDTIEEYIKEYREIKDKLEEIMK